MNWTSKHFLETETSGRSGRQAKFFGFGLPVPLMVGLEDKTAGSAESLLEAAVRQPHCPCGRGSESLPASACTLTCQETGRPLGQPLRCDSRALCPGLHLPGCLETAGPGTWAPKGCLVRTVPRPTVMGWVKMGEAPPHSTKPPGQQGPKEPLTEPSSSKGLHFNQARRSPS